jgi:hypothetical protein
VVFASGLSEMASTRNLKPHDLAQSDLVLIHELVHVWHGEYRPGFVWNSLWHQLIDSDAYAYRSGQDWKTYSVEQQAAIVEDWFNPLKGGESISDERYRYIEENIRRGARC